MSVFIFREAASTGARVLAEALAGGVRVRRPETITRRARSGDLFVGWGSIIGSLPTGVKALNNTAFLSKFTAAEKLKAAGVSTVEVSRTRPQPTATVAAPDTLPDLWEIAADHAEAFIGLEAVRSPVAIEGVRDFLKALTDVHRVMQTPAPVAPPPVPTGEWVGRSNNHAGGADLLNPIANPDYFVKRETFVTEYRVHSFLGHSLRAGKKIAREGVQQHPWIRTWDGGWKLHYDGVTVKQKHRDIAHAAVKALGLDFGAVDIGERADGTLVVLEVNRAPGLEGGTIEAYSRAIGRVVSGEWTA